MPHAALVFLDWFFIVFHTVLVLFNVFGWAVRKWRRWNLWCLAITAISWFVMGLWYGVGYCICTDWHWQVRQALGYELVDRTYVQFLVRTLTGIEPPLGLTKTVSGVVFVVALVLSIALNLRDRKLKLETEDKINHPLNRYV